MGKFNWVINTLALLLVSKINNCDARASITGVQSQHQTIPKDYTVMYYSLEDRSVVPSTLIGDNGELSTYSASVLKHCECTDWECSCCAGMAIAAIGFDHTVCTNVTMIPEESIMQFALVFDHSTVLNYDLAVGETTPLCYTIRENWPEVKFCVRLDDWRVFSDEIDACVKINAYVSHSSVYTLNAGCMHFGNDSATTTMVTRPSEPATTTVTYTGPTTVI